MTNPPTRRRFGSISDELYYRNEKAHFWFYIKSNRRNTLPHIKRLRYLLNIPNPDEEDSLAFWAASALASESDGDFDKAILCREKELAMAMRLHEIVNAIPDLSRWGRKWALGRWSTQGLKWLRSTIRRLKRTHRPIAQNSSTYNVYP